MLSEIDLRDWEKVDFKEARDNVYRAYDDGQYVAVDELFKFIGQVEAIMKKQVPQVAVLLKEGGGYD